MFSGLRIVELWTLFVVGIFNESKHRLILCIFRLDVEHEDTESREHDDYFTFIGELLGVTVLTSTADTVGYPR